MRTKKAMSPNKTKEATDHRCSGKTDVLVNGAYVCKVCGTGRGRPAPASVVHRLGIKL